MILGSPVTRDKASGKVARERLVPTHVALTLSSGCLVVRYPLTGSGLFTVFTRVSLTAIWFPRHVPQGSGRAPWNCSRRRRRSTWRARPCWTGNRSWRTAVIFRYRSWAHRARHLGCWGNVGTRRPVRCNRRRRRSYHLLRWRHLVAGHRATSRTGVSLLEKIRFSAIHLPPFFFNLTVRDRFNVRRHLTVARYLCIRIYVYVHTRIRFPVSLAGNLPSRDSCKWLSEYFRNKTSFILWASRCCWMGIGSMFGCLWGYFCVSMIFWEDSLLLFRDIFGGENLHVF